MSDENSAGEPDSDWSLYVGEMLARRSWLHGPPVATMYHLEAGIDLLRSIDMLIERHDGPGLPFLPQPLAERIALQGGQILATIDSSGPYGIPTLTGLETRLGFDPVINIADPYTLEAMNLKEGRRHGFPFEPSFSREAAEEAPDIALIDEETARTGFIAMLADAYRSARNWLAGANNPAPGSIEFTVHTKLKDYVLDHTPEYAVTWSRFGRARTSPVADKLYSGHYFFRGKDGRSIRKDGTRHLVSSERTETTLSW